MSKERVTGIARSAVAYGTLVFLGAASLFEGAACASSSPSPQTCLSPATVSKLYEGDPTATSDRATWHLGVLATTRGLRRDASCVGLVFGFRDSATTPWRLSNPVGRQGDADQAVQLTEGNGPVQFGTFVEAAAGSADCQHAPDTTFSDQPMPLSGFSGTRPVWPS